MAGWDVHTHLIPPTVLSAAHRGEFGLSVESNSLVIDGQRLPLQRLADPAALLHWIATQELDGAVVSVTGKVIKMQMDTVCIHGDTHGAVDIARGLRQALKDAGISVAPFRRLA